MPYGAATLGMAVSRLRFRYAGEEIPAVLRP